jgi:hypothetical protein
MLKHLYTLIIIFLVFPINSSVSQTKRENRITNERTRNWQYESICFEAGGSGSSYLIEITSYVADLKLALPQAKKNAIHAVLFKGVSGNNLGCTTKEPLIPNGVYEDNFNYFEDFFYNTEQYNQFATSPSGAAEKSENLTRKNFRVTFIISVNVETLRKKLEFDKIIEPLGKALDVAGGPKPTIMVFPSDIWMNENGYMNRINNQGKTDYVPDYQRALLNPKLGTMMRTLEDMLIDRGYSPKKLSEEIKSIAEGDAIGNAVSGRDGGSSESSLLEDILNVAKPDIRWSVTWSQEGNGIQNWVDYGIEAIDSYTGKKIAGADDTGPKSMSASESELIRQAVSDKMDDFLSEHQDYFNGLVKNGREIVLDIRRFDSFEHYFNDDIEFNGQEMEFSQLVRSFLGKIAKDRNFTYNATENRINVSQMRIELTEEKEDLWDPSIKNQEPLDAVSFSKKLTKFIKKNFNYPSKVTPIGVGKAVIYIGEK